MGAGFGMAFGAALQGIGAGMLQEALERRRFALEQLRAQAKEGFTLGKGQVRYGADGREVARGPEDAGEGSGLAKEVADATGFQIGSKEHQNAMTSVMNGKYGTDYADDQGNIRRRPALGMSGSQSADTGIKRVASIEEARKLPPGTKFLDPNGIERTVPGGPTQSASGGFPSVPSGNPLDPRDHRR